MREQSFGKGATVSTGDHVALAGVVVDGVVAEFYELEDGTRRCKWLAGPGDVFASEEDLGGPGTAQTTIETLTPCVVVHAPYAHIRQLAASDQHCAAFLVALIERLYVRKSDREYALLALKADDRYGWFEDRFGPIAHQLSRETVASFLGISPVHLSRISAARRALLSTALHS